MVFAGIVMPKVRQDLPALKRNPEELFLPYRKRHWNGNAGWSSEQGIDLGVLVLFLPLPLTCCMILGKSLHLFPSPLFCLECNLYVVVLICVCAATNTTGPWCLLSPSGPYVTQIASNNNKGRKRRTWRERMGWIHAPTSYDSIDLSGVIPDSHRCL